MILSPACLPLGHLTVFDTAESLIGVVWLRLNQPGAQTVEPSGPCGRDVDVTRGKKEIEIEKLRDAEGGQEGGEKSSS